MLWGFVGSNRQSVFMKNIFRITLIILLLVVMFHSCANDMDIIKKIIDAEIEPDMVGENVELLYSDSARLQMRLVTPLIKQFNSATERRREFPQGLHIWFYEKSGELKAELTANWAKEDMETEIWEARSNVVLTNVEGQILESEQLFWDPKKGEVHSSKYTKIITKDGDYEGSGDSFWAKQDFTEYKFFNKSGVGRTTIYYKEDNEKN